MTMTMEDLVPVSQGFHPYVLMWGSADDIEEGARECVALVVLTREGGIILAVPVDFFTEAELEKGNQDGEDGVLGASEILLVNAVDHHSGEPVADGLPVLVVDMDARVLENMRVYLEEEDAPVMHFEEDPTSVPVVSELVAKTFAWLKEVYNGEPPYEATPEVTAESEVQALPKAAQKAAPKAAKAKAKQSGAMPTGGPKPKKATAANLAATMETMAATLSALVQRQEVLENHVKQAPVSALLSQPLGGEVVPKSNLAGLTKNLGPPPKTSGVLMIPPATTPQEILDVEGDPAVGAPSGMEKAMLAQSAALTSLVAHLASSSGDPLTELTHGTTTGTKGAAGRARLQMELASHSGSFFNAVMKSMARRMSPTSSAEISHESMMQAGISGTRYLERFGGYGRCRDLGLVQYQVMSAMDFLQVGNYGAAKDVVALLAVMLEQAVLDGGRFEVAQVLTLQEDVPYTVFSARQGSVARRAFAPLADQRWVTVALAYLKELETISSKRVEMLSSQASVAGGGASSQLVPVPKQKAAVKKKPRRGAGAQDGEEEAE